MDQSKVQQAVQSLFDMEIEIHPISLDVIERSVEIAYSYVVTVYDSVFVALAEKLGISFITADEKLIQKLSDFPNVHHLSKFMDNL